MKLSKLGTIRDACCEFRIKTLYKFIANLHTEKSARTVKAAVDAKVATHTPDCALWVGVRMP